MTEFYDYSEPKRLHPLTLVYRGITNAPALFIPLYFALDKGATDELFYVAIMIFILIFTFPAIILNYYFFKFQITENELVINSGIIAKKQKNIPIRRIQNINMEQNFLQRILGLTKVQIETAGEATAEGVLEFISKKDAEEIINTIKKYQHNYNENKNSTITENLIENLDVSGSIVKNHDDSAVVLFSMSPIKILQYGMLRFRPVALVFGAWIFSMLQQFMPSYNIEDELIGSNLDFVDSLNTTELILYGVVAVLIIVISSWILDIILTFNKFYGFSLTKDSNKFITNYGLFTKRHITIPLKKLQSIVITTNPIKKIINYYSMGLQTAGMGANPSQNAVAVPFANKDELTILAQNIRDFEFPSEFLSVSKKTIRRAIVKYFMYFLPVVAGLYFVSNTALWLLLIAPLLVWAAVLRWQYRGYKIEKSMVFVKQGFWFQKLTIVPIEKIQTLLIKESFFQRRLGLATLHIDTAAGIFASDCSIIDIDSSDAVEITDLLMDEFKNFQKRKN